MEQFTDAVNAVDAAVAGVTTPSRVTDQQSWERVNKNGNVLGGEFACDDWGLWGRRVSGLADVRHRGLV